MDTPIPLSELMQLPASYTKYVTSTVFHIGDVGNEQIWLFWFCKKPQPYLYTGFGCYHISAMLEILRLFWPPKWTSYIVYSLFENTDWSPDWESWRDLWHSLCLVNNILYWQMGSSPQVFIAWELCWISSYILNKYTHFTTTFETMKNT